MQLKQKPNQTLLLELKECVRVEKLSTVAVLEYLFEVNRRRLYLEENETSLFAFCINSLGYSEPEANLRIQAVRAMKDVPEILNDINEGKINLTNVARAQRHFRQQEAQDKPLTPEEKKEVLNGLQNCSTREAEKKLDDLFCSDKKRRLEFYASPELIEKLDKLKGLLAHENYSGDLAVLIELLADKTLKQFEKKNEPKADAPPQGAHSVEKESSTHSSSRYIPAETRRRVWKEAGGRCEHFQNGKRCKSTHALEIDHIILFAQGGTHERENLRLLCAVHNKARARGETP